MAVGSSKKEVTSRRFGRLCFLDASTFVRFRSFFFFSKCNENSRILMMDRGNTKKEELHKRMEERMKKGELGKLKEYKNGEIPRF